MTPKLLQKKSNRFLQLALPENLIANKRIGKREKYHHRPGAAANILRGMEKRILGQWAFSWNMYKKKETLLSTRLAGRPEKMQSPLSPRARLFMPPVTVPDFLVPPSLYILGDRAGRTLGGNVIQYLKDSERSAPTNHPSRLPPRLGGKSTWQHPSASGGTGAAPFSTPFCHFPGDWGGLETPPALLTNVPVHFGPGGGEMVTEHCRKNNFTMIYSLVAAQILQKRSVGGRGDRRDRIADQYRNQLAEWRKIAFLYGGLGRKAAVRLQRRAHLLGGDVGVNFLSLLESRLDVVLKRAFFFSTLKAARQGIQRGKIYVNNQRCTLAGTLLQPADLITISPGARAEWRKERLRTFAAINEKTGQISHGGPRFSPRYRVTENNSTKRWESPSGKGQMAFPQHLSLGNRRFPFSPPLMRKWKEWSEIWANSPYSFSQKHEWRTNPMGGPKFSFSGGIAKLSWGGDKFTGKNGIRGVSSTQSFYSSSSFFNYLSGLATLQGGQYLESEKKKRNANPTPQSSTSSPGFSLLERRETSITNLVSGLSSPTFHKRQGPPGGGDNRLHRIGPAKPQWQGTRRDKSGQGATRTESTFFLFKRLGQAMGEERKSRCQWLHQHQSNVVDGLHSLRWNRGFARKKSQGEKKDQLSCTSFKPLHLECSYRLGTVIFLFFPQKLAWPSSINVSLLGSKA